MGALFPRRIAPKDHEAIAAFLDERTLALRWLVAFFRRQDLFPAEESERWSLWCGVDEVGKVGCVAVHFFPLATTYLALGRPAGAAAGGDDAMDLSGLGDLLEDELLPERIVGDAGAMEMLRDALPEVFERAVGERRTFVLAFGAESGASSGGAAHPEAPGAFRAAVPSDLGILEEYGRLFAAETGDDPGFDFETLVEHGLVFVVECEGKVAGLVRSNVSDGKYVHAGMLYVHPRWRSRGVGRELARGLGRWIREREGASAILDVREENPAALRAYEGAGYRKVGEGLELLMGEDAWR